MAELVLSPVHALTSFNTILVTYTVIKKPPELEVYLYPDGEPGTELTALYIGEMEEGSAFVFPMRARNAGQVDITGLRAEITGDVNGDSVTIVGGTVDLAPNEEHMFELRITLPMGSELEDRRFTIEFVSD